MIRRYRIIVGAIVALVAAAIIWDYAKLGRTPPEPATVPEQADRILIEKQARRLTLFKQGRQLRAYRVSLGSSPMGPKEQEGDGRTPEGLYSIDAKNAASGFHLALRISYPGAADEERAAARRAATS